MFISRSTNKDLGESWENYSRLRTHIQGRRIAALPHILTGQCTSRPLLSRQLDAHGESRSPLLSVRRRDERLHALKPRDPVIVRPHWGRFLSLSLSLFDWTNGFPRFLLRRSQGNRSTCVRVEQGRFK